MQQAFPNLERVKFESLPLGLSYYPNFITFEYESKLIQQLDSQTFQWSNELKRRVQHYGYKYNYSEKKVAKENYLGPLPDIFEPIIEKLRNTIQSKRPNQIIVNEYLPGQGIGKHIDCVTCFEEQICSLSLGSNCEMEFEEVGTGNFQVTLLERCSLISLKGPARYNWQHSIKPKLSDNGIKRSRRISLTFRNVIL